MSYSQFVMSLDAVKRPIGDHTAVYHRQRGGLCLLDDRSNQLFESFLHPRSIPPSWMDEDPSERDAELFQQLLARGLVRDTQDSSSELPADSGVKVNVIQLILANACNFGCTYCFEGIQGKELSVEQEVAKIDLSRLKSREEIKVDLNNSMYASRERLQHQYDPKNRHMKPEDAIRYVKDALAVSVAPGATGAMVQFFGGEPFLNWKAIDAVLEEFGRGEKHGIRIDYSTVTNGSLLTEAIAAKLAKYEVGVCVSFDSPTSPSRPLKNGDDSTPVVMQGLRLLQKHRNRVAINAALTSATWEEFNNSIVDLAVEVDAGEIGVVVDFDPTFYARFGTANIVEKLWQVVEYGRQRGVVLTGYWHQIFQVLLGHDVVTERGFKNCSAKGAQFSIEPNGSVFSCKAGSTLLGTIEQGKDLLNQPAYQAHHALRNDNPAFCKGCEIEGFCAGLCLGPLEKKFAAIDVIEPSACDFYRGITLKHIQALQPYEVATFDLQPA